ncbi:MAG TPA: hypothetical protein VGF34_05790 [Stellaceae bacterium]|jgi:hypothetical protein
MFEFRCSAGLARKAQMNFALPGRADGIRALAAIATIAGMMTLAATAAWATPTTVTIATKGTLTVDLEGNLTANVAEGLPSSGFFDVYKGTFKASVMNVPTLPIKTPYALSLSGSVDIAPQAPGQAEQVFMFENAPLPTLTAAEANALAVDAESFAGSPSGLFFPDFLHDVFYAYDEAGNITIGSQTNLATVLPDSGPLFVFHQNGVFTIDTSGLTIVATPEVAEPASATVLGSALASLILLFAANTRRRSVNQPR